MNKSYKKSRCSAMPSDSWPKAAPKPSRFAITAMAAAAAAEGSIAESRIFFYLQTFQNLNIVAFRNSE